MKLEYVVGWVIGEVFSSVSGYILDNIFFGSIFVNNDIYYVDPLKVRLIQFVIFKKYILILFRKPRKHPTKVRKRHFAFLSLATNL